MNSKKISIYSSCIVVEGALNSIICDLQKEIYYELSLNMVKFLALDIEVDKFEKTLSAEELISFKYSLNELINSEYLFYGLNSKKFPPLDLHWDEPYVINNAIIDLNQASKYNITKVISELSDLQCPHVQVRCYDIISIEVINSLLAKIQQGNIISVDLLVKYDDGKTEFYKEFFNKYSKLCYLYVYDSPEFKVYPFDEINKCAIINITQEVYSEQCCGIVSSSLFMVNIKLFTEAQKFNSCLNRKISIDANGEIKNCPTMKTTYGNVDKNNLIDVLNLDKFKAIWNINKDQIKICKDCEYRYICTDCRAFSRTDINYNKPLKCGYDPYTGVWK